MKCWPILMLGLAACGAPGGPAEEDCPPEREYGTRSAV